MLGLWKLPFMLHWFGPSHQATRPGLSAGSGLEIVSIPGGSLYDDSTFLKAFIDITDDQLLQGLGAEGRAAALYDIVRKLLV